MYLYDRLLCYDHSSFVEQLILHQDSSLASIVSSILDSAVFHSLKCQSSLEGLLLNNSEIWVPKVELDVQIFTNIDFAPVSKSTVCGKSIEMNWFNVCFICCLWLSLQQDIVFDKGCWFLLNLVFKHCEDHKWISICLECIWLEKDIWKPGQMKPKLPVLLQFASTNPLNEVLIMPHAIPVACYRYISERRPWALPTDA